LMNLAVSAQLSTGLNKCGRIYRRRHTKVMKGQPLGQ
jgi:hypothetical protein